MKDTVTIIDVAKKAGVVKSTVSNVLTGKRFVSEELKKKVLDACEELNFHPNFYAAGLSSHKSNIIALLLESDDEVGKLFYQTLIIACLKQAAKKDYSLLIYYNPSKTKLVNTLRRGIAPIDGAILMSPCVNDQRLKQIEKECIDCVVIGRPDCSVRLSYVDIDNVKLVQETCNRLFALYGKEIYFINSDPVLTISQDRAKSFALFCDEKKIDFGSRVMSSKTSSEEDGYAFAMEKMKKDCVFVTANEHLAAGVYRAAEERGFKIGEEVGVFSLGRSMKHGVFTPALSYAEQDYTEIGKKAVDQLIAKIEKGKSEMQVLLESRVIFSESVKKIQNKY